VRAALWGVLLFGAFIVLACLCSHFWGQQQGGKFSIIDYIRALAGMPAFFLFGGAVVSEAVAGLICVVVNSLLGGFIFASLMVVWRLIVKIIHNVFCTGAKGH
jgi:hypothetical protein